MTKSLPETLAAIKPLNVEAREAARRRQDTLTKPHGSLGQLEDLSIRLAGMMGSPRPKIRHKAIITMAADHGVAAEGVSLYPQEVTRQMVFNFLGGGAAINVLARHVGARVVVVDMGVIGGFEPHPELVCKMIDFGTRNMAQGPAMSREQALAAIETGIEVIHAEIAKGLDIVGTGDMGIGNTTSASAVCAVMTGKPVVEVTGRGTGLGDEQLGHKVAVIQKALQVNQPNPDDPLDVLARVGGFEIGGLAGVLLGAAANRIPVVIDGFISGAAALIAAGLSPAVSEYLIAAHLSVETGHRVTLDYLRLTPLLNLRMRLGEGSGAALAIGIAEAAAKILDEMATFAEAGVSEAEGGAVGVGGSE